jgi:hypothetical protein
MIISWPRASANGLTESLLPAASAALAGVRAARGIFSMETRSQRSGRRHERVRDAFFSMTLPRLKKSVPASRSRAETVKEAQIDR